MTAGDVRASRAGRVTATVALVVPAAAAILVLGAAEEWRWASIGLGVCGVLLVMLSPPTSDGPAGVE